MGVEQASRHLPHHLPTTGELLKWMGRHKTRLTMAAIALGSAGYLTVAHDRGSQNPAVTVNNPVSDTFKPDGQGAGSEVVLPATNPTEVTPVEVTPVAGASASPEPPPTQEEPTKTPPTPTAEPTKAPATPEAKMGFDCGIFSPGACANGDYVQWGVWSPTGIVKVQGMAFTLKPGEKARIQENFVVAASKYNEPGAYNGHAIKGITRDGKRSIKFIGDVEPTNGVAQVGKDFPAGTVVGIAGNTGEAVLPGLKYNLLVILPTEEDLKNTFPDQTKKPPIIIKNETLESEPKQPQGGGGGAIFFDVTPPKT